MRWAPLAFLFLGAVALLGAGMLIARAVPGTFLHGNPTSWAVGALLVFAALCGLAAWGLVEGAAWAKPMGLALAVPAVLAPTTLLGLSMVPAAVLAAAFVWVQLRWQPGTPGA